MSIFSRNELYWGQDAQEKLAQKHVAVFGLGGVGGYTAEMLARAGVGELTIVDFDKVAPSNLNRQIIAIHSTIGQSKALLFEKRLKDINPKLKLNVIHDFYTEKLNGKLIGLNPDFIADAIDSMRSKIDLLSFTFLNNIPVISSFGAGNRVNPEDLYICDISQIENKKDVFVSNVLYQLKKRGITQGITAVVSREKPICLEKISVTEKLQTQEGEEIEFTKITPSSTPFVASCAGIFMASYIVRQFLK